jgi:queuine tRNA-ribosyltransferase
MNFFELIKTDSESKARVGILHTDHGDVPTPIFMPVGTQGTVKALEQRSLLELDAKIILGNTYHLYLRPGMDVIQHFGGLHKFIKWRRAILTDSGGYQVFSLQDLRRISDEGVEFRSHIDGSRHFFSPKKVVEIQKILGSDIMMVLDECVPYGADEQYTRRSMELSFHWALESRKLFFEIPQMWQNKQFQFAVCQGGMYHNLRKEYVNRVVEHDFDGYSIGGLSVGEPTELMYELTDLSTEILPQNKPRYLMGVGTPENILEAIERGVDMFDCVLPTRNARNGQIFTTRGKINIRNNQYKFSDEPIDPAFANDDEINYTLGYLRHLFISREILGLILATRQNIRFYLWLVRTAREKILTGEFRQWKKDFLSSYLQKI